MDKGQSQYKRRNNHSDHDEGIQTRSMGLDAFAFEGGLGKPSLEPNARLDKKERNRYDKVER